MSIHAQQPQRTHFPFPRRGRWADLLVVAAVVGLLFAVLGLAREWAAVAPPPLNPEPIDLSLYKLPVYAFYSLSRGLIAYVLSFLFTLGYGYWAAKDPVAEKGLIPLLDILQSIPVLGFMPGLVLVLVHLMPTRMVGRELAAIIMIFTGQVWNMTFSFYQSLKAQPADQLEVARMYRFSAWQRFRWVELPFSAVGLIWNSMMSMAGGWFFLMICESFTLGSENYRLPGLGSYMAQAVENKDGAAMVWAVVAMVVMIVTLDQFFWNPITVWSQKFRTEEGGAPERQKSWFLDFLWRSRLIRLVGRWLKKDESPTPTPVEATKEMSRPDLFSPPPLPPPRPPSPWPKQVSLIAFALLIAALLYGAFRLILLLREVPGDQWLRLFEAAGLTLLRVLSAVALGTLWAVPVGLFIGLSPRLRQWAQPVVQVMASFPAPMLFPLVVVILQAVGVSLNWGAIVLMLLGTQWYILFNVVAGASAVPSDLQEIAHSYRLGWWQRFWVLHLPAILPFLLTGWVTAAGGAWNASIVAELVLGKELEPAMGLGAEISMAVSPDDSGNPNVPMLAAAVLIMALVVVTFNRVVWRPLQHLAATRYSLSK